MGQAPRTTQGQPVRDCPLHAENGFGVLRGSTKRHFVQKSNRYLLLCGPSSHHSADQVSSLRQACSRTKGAFLENGVRAKGPSSTVLCCTSSCKHFSWHKINHWQEWLFEHSKSKSIALPLCKSILGNSNL